jgi:hypothetical protein
MNGPMYIPISANALNTAAELARQCSATTVRERVFVSQVVALAVREYLHRTAGLRTDAGRSASLKYVELLDICDFSAGDWRVEMRVITHVERLALYVPTVPLMVLVVSERVALYRYLLGADAAIEEHRWPEPLMQLNPTFASVHQSGRHRLCHFGTRRAALSDDR